MTVLPTAGTTDGGQHRRHAEEVPVSDESLLTEALVSVGVTGSVQSTGGRVTSLPTLAGDAGERLRAGDGGRASLWKAGSSWEGVTECSLTAGTGGTLRSDDTLSIETTDHPLTHGGALAALVLSVPDLTPAPGRVVLGDTDGVLPAGDGGAGVDTGGGLAGQLSRAVLVLPALHSGGRAHTAGKVGISSGASRTLALVAPVLIDTPGLGAAGVLQALVNISTASERVSSVTSLTETLGRVGGRTVSINTALEPLAGTLTLAPVSGVSEEWWGTDALARLHTLLVRTTVSVSAALDLVG